MTGCGVSENRTQVCPSEPVRKKGKERDFLFIAIVISLLLHFVILLLLIAFTGNGHDLPFSSAADPTQLYSRHNTVELYLEPAVPADKALAQSVSIPPHPQQQGTMKEEITASHNFTQSTNASPRGAKVSSAGLEEQAPHPLTYGNKKYPEAAHDQGIEGVVLCLVCLDEQGAVVRIRIITPAGHGFDEAAVEYIQTTTWMPGYQNGNPVPSSFLCPVGFSLLDAP
jgi:TonB family protein